MVSRLASTEIPNTKKESPSTMWNSSGQYTSPSAGYFA